jgi:large subunit ribosomal protein L29
MKNSEIKQLSVEQMQEAIATAELKLQKLDFAHAISPIENPMQIRHTKKEIARLKTEMHARTLAAVKTKVEANELTRFNAREFLQKENSALPTPMDLGKIKKIIGQFEK